MEDELHSSQQQYRQCLDELEQFERKIHDLEREIAQGKELNSKYCRDVSIHCDFVSIYAFKSREVRLKTKNQS